jgi:hypothetical protein
MTFGRPRCESDIYVKMPLKKQFGRLDRIGVAADNDRLCAVVITVMNLQVQYITGNFLRSRGLVSF